MHAWNYTDRWAVGGNNLLNYYFHIQNKIYGQKKISAPGIAYWYWT